MKEPFSLQQFIRSTGCKNFTLKVVEGNEEYLEMLIETVSLPKQSFGIYIEKNNVFGKTALDSFKKHYAPHLKNKNFKFNSKNLYKGLSVK